MIYRLEVHQTETGRYFSQLWDGDHDNATDPLWESKYYDDMDDAYSMARYEFDTRCETDREAASIARLKQEDQPDHGRDAGMSSGRHWL